MTDLDMRRLIYDRIESYRYRSAWGRGVCMYALDLTNEFDFDAIGSKSIRDIMLDGASNWREYSYCCKSLIYDWEIAARLLTPSAFKRKKYGRLPPNSKETWLDVQARALEQASGLVMMAIHGEFYDGLGK